jgi:geranylgeranyl diphosphate synthase type 3
MHTVKVEEVLFEPYEYIIQNPGKDIRTLLISAFNIWLKVPQDKVCAHAPSLPKCARN